MSEPTTGRCRDCRWHDFEEHRLDGHCSHEKMISDYHRKTPIDGIRTEDDEGWGFYVGPDFGCVHWEARDCEVHL